ncbi:hypothetical protein M3629_00370 [Paenibacillus polysaccharolyticus]|uniref:hypothetical protein n=1 Tax=Paenibacillus polysaccharolyticus TaxID=582692 RepID=UPI002040A2A1|nr:hypothetical protein [Paenibacillus polysaccharolyticus]MCM3131217.1 hypothetical protein [Paenibacillus polysaccharolyticus]
MNIKELLTIVIASVAATVSIIALIKTHYDKFKLVFSGRDITFKINKWRNGKDNWYQIFIFLPLRIANSSNSIGKIDSMRMKLIYENKLLAPIYEIFPVDFELISENDESFSHRLKGDSLEKIIQNDWHPLILKNKDVIETHLLFSGRWDKLLNISEFRVQLEVKMSQKLGWKKVEEWDGNLNMILWSELIHKDTAVNFQRSYITVSPKDERNKKKAHEMFEEEFEIPQIDITPSISDK